LKNATGYVGQGRLGSIGKFFPYGQERTATANGTEKFATYTRDAETGLDYAQNRYHSSGDGRFLNPDPYGGSASLGDPGSWNRYVYVGGDPVGRVDPSGLDWCDATYVNCIETHMCLEAGELGRVYNRHMDPEMSPSDYAYWDHFCNTAYYWDRDVAPPISAQGPDPERPVEPVGGEGGGFDTNSIALGAAKASVLGLLADPGCQQVLGFVGANAFDAAVRHFNGLTIAFGSMPVTEDGIRYGEASLNKPFVLLNSQIDWLSPALTRVYRADGSVYTVDMLASTAALVGHAVRLDQFMPFWLLHETAHTRGLNHSGPESVAGYNRALWEGCFK
jgi:RHS repeat-associated protein